MIIKYIHRILWLAGLVLLQVLVLNNVNIGGYATPFLYVYLMIKLDSETSRNSLLLWGFALGLLVDIFSDTPGINTSATVFLAFMRPSLLKLFVPRDVIENIIPSFKTIGITPFLKYLSISVVIHTALLLTVEYFSFVHLAELLLKIIFSSILTISCIMAMEGIRNK